MFTVEELAVVQKSYLASSQTNEGKEFAWIHTVSDLFDLSADECVLNKLDEDMSEEEYREWGPSGKQLTISNHYRQYAESNRSADIPPFQLQKENKTIFSQAQRKHVLNLLHQMIEKKTLSQNEMMHQFGIAVEGME